MAQFITEKTIHAGNPSTFIDGWQSLGNAVVQQAAIDYREYKRKLKKLAVKQFKDGKFDESIDTKCRILRGRIREVENFFIGRGNSTIDACTRLNGCDILEKLRREVV